MKNRIKIFICKMTNTPLNPYYIISCSIWCKILKEVKQEVLNNITEEWANSGAEMMKVQTNIKSADIYLDPLLYLMVSVFVIMGEEAQERHFRSEVSFFLLLTLQLFFFPYFLAVMGKQFFTGNIWCVLYFYELSYLTSK